MLSLHGYFLCFHLGITSHPLPFSEPFQLSHFITSSRGIVQFLWTRKTGLMPSLSTASLLPSLPFISALPSLICLCVSSFSPCHLTRRAIYVPVPVSVSKSELHRSSQGRCAGACLNRESPGGLMCVQQQDSPTWPLSASALAH